MSRFSLFHSCFYLWIQPLISRHWHHVKGVRKRKSRPPEISDNDLSCVPLDFAPSSTPLLPAKRPDGAGSLTEWDILFALVSPLRKDVFIGIVFELLNIFFLQFPPMIFIYLSKGGLSQASLEHPGTLLAPLGLCFSMLTVILGKKLLVNQSFWVMNRTGTYLKNGLMTNIYIKLFRLSGASRHTFPAGKVIHLAASDVMRIGAAWNNANLVWSCPLQIIIALSLLYARMGSAAFAGVLVLGLFIPAQAFFIKYLGKQADMVHKATEKRLDMLQESIQGIRVVKYCALEGVFKDRLTGIRDQELRAIRRLSLVGAACTTITFCTGLLITASCLWAHVVLCKRKIGPDFFICMIYFSMFERALMYLPMVIGLFIGASASLKRVKAFLDADQSPSSALIEETLHRAVLGVKDDRGDDSERLPIIEIKQCVFQWDPVPKAAAASSINEEASTGWGEEGGGDQPAPVGPASPFLELLDLANLSIKKGSLTAVVGGIGSGKSSLLYAIAGEMPKHTTSPHQGQGTHILRGSLSLCPQQSWIQNATIRDNILFGKALDQARYERVLEQSAIIQDLSRMPSGDLTEVGERGVNLSGGQKLRINFARAVYHDSDVVLLDDPLSAVDAHVGKALFEGCIVNGLLRDKTRILVTHHLHVLPHVDEILVMDQGRIVQRGAYAELCESDTHFAETLRRFSVPIEKENAIGAELEGKGDDQKGPLTLSTEASINAKDDDAVSSVSFATYVNYARFTGKPVVLLLATLLGMLVVNGLQFWASLILCNWVQGLASPSNSTGDANHAIKYGVVCLLVAVFDWLNYAIHIVAGHWASRSIHKKSLDNHFKATIAYFDKTSSGRILGKFGKDMGVIDTDVPVNLTWYLYSLFCVARLLACLGYALFRRDHWLRSLVLITVLGAVLVIPERALQVVYESLSGSIQRAQSDALGPLLSNIGETFSGASMLRVFRMQRFYLAKHHSVMDHLNRTGLLNLGLQRWVSTQSGVLGSVLAFLVCLACVSGHVGSAAVGFAVSSVLGFTEALDWCIRQFADTEAAMAAVERLSLYYNAAPEGDSGSRAFHGDDDANAIANALRLEAPSRNAKTRLPGGWPSQGHIQFVNVVLRYGPSLPPVLHGISFAIGPRERVAVVGRTGAGKSSVLTALLRVVELSSGTIAIDSVDISTVGLADLRTKVAIVPQDAVLFSGALRFNLDPSMQRPDAELWAALERTSMRETIMRNEGGLDQHVTANGDNFSAGQRQLLCLARALLRSTKILLMDEATASIDLYTDSIIQRSLRDHFSGCTIITIAHRINTILDYDKVLVMDAGRAIEYDRPGVLLANPDSLFTKLVAKARAKNWTET